VSESRRLQERFESVVFLLQALETSNMHCPTDHTGVSTTFLLNIKFCLSLLTIAVFINRKHMV